MSKELRSESQVNFNKADKDDRGDWVFLKAVSSSVPAVLYFSPPGKKVGKTVDDGRDVLASGRFLVRTPKKSVLLEVKKGRLDSSTAKDGFNLSLDLDVGDLPPESTSKRSSSSKGSPTEEERRRVRAIRDVLLQKLRLPGRIKGALTRLRAVSKDKAFFSFRVYSELRDLQPMVLLDLPAVVAGQGEKLRRGAPKTCRVVKGEAWLEDRILYLRPSAGSWAPFLKTVKLATKGRVEKVLLAAELPVDRVEATNDPSTAAFNLALSEELEFGPLETDMSDPPEDPLIQKLLEQAAEAEKQEEEEENRKLEDIKRRHQQLQDELGYCFASFPKDGSDKELRRLLYLATQEDPALPELMRQAVRRLEALDQELQALGMPRQQRADEFWAFIPAPFRRGKYGTTSQRAFAKTAKIRQELMGELDKAGNPMEIIGDIGSVITIVSSSLSIKSDVGSIAKDGMVGKWDGGKGLLAGGEAGKDWRAQDAFLKLHSMMGTVGGVVTGAPGLVEGGLDLQEVNEEQRREQSPGRQMMLQRKHARTRRALVTGAMEFTAGIGAHFVPGLGVIASGASLYREGHKAHDYWMKAQQGKIILESSENRGEQTKEHLVGSFEQSVGRYENRRNLAVITTTLTAVSLGGDVAVASILGAPIGGIIKSSAEISKALTRFTYRGIDTFRARLAKQAEEGALREGSTEEEQLKAFENHPHYAKIAIALAAKSGDTDAMAFFQALGLSREDIQDPEITLQDLTNFALEEAEESANPGTMLDDVKAIGRVAKEVWESLTASQAEKFAKRLEANLAEMSGLAGELNQASALYRDALLSDQSSGATTPSATTRSALKRLVKARASLQKWTVQQTEFADEWDLKRQSFVDQGNEPPPPVGSAQHLFDAHQKRVEDGKAVPQAIDAIRGMITQLDTLHARSLPESLKPANAPLTEAEKQQLALRAPWPVEDDPVLLSSKAEVQQREGLNVVRLSKATAEVELLQEELRDYLSRGIEPTAQMKDRLKKALKDLKKLEEELTAVQQQLPAARKKVSELDPTAVAQERIDELTQVLQGVDTLSAALLKDLGPVRKLAARVEQLTEAKQGRLSSLFFDPTHAQLWLSAGKVTATLERHYLEAKKLSSEAEFLAKDIEDARKSGVEPIAQLKELQAVHKQTKILVQDINGLDKDVVGRQKELALAIQTATDPDLEDLRGALESLKKAALVRVDHLNLLAGVLYLWEDSADRWKVASKEDRRPAGLYRNPRALEAYKKHLKRLETVEEAARKSMQTTADAAADSPELQAGIRILRVYRASFTLEKAKLAQADRELVKATEALEKELKTLKPGPRREEVEGWKGEAGPYRSALDEAVKRVDPLPEALGTVIERRQRDLTKPPEVLDVPTFRHFGATLEKYLSFLEKVDEAMPALPTLRSSSAQTVKEQAEKDLQALEKSVADMRLVVRSHLDQLPLDRRILSARSLRLPAGLDLEDVQQGLRMLEQLKGGLTILESALNTYEKQRKKLLAVAMKR